MTVLQKSNRITPGLCVMALAAFALLLDGCAMRREGPALGTQAGTMRQGIYETPMNTVVVLDRDLAVWTGRDWSSDSKIAIQRHGAQRLETSALEVVTEVRNRTNQSVSVELRTTFYDGQEFPLGEPSKWQPVNLPPQGTSNYRETSLSPQAANYLVEVRNAQRR